VISLRNTHIGALLLLAALSVPADAVAAACCVLAAPGRSGRLPEAEVFGVLAAYSMEGRPGAWTSSGDLRMASSDLQFSHRLTPQLLVRPFRLLQASVALPVMLNASRFGGQEYVGGGIGDLAVLFRVEPVAVGSFRAAPPLPGIGLGISVPTGRATWQVDSGNPAAVTGTGYLTFTPGFTLDKTFEGGSIGWDISGSVSPPRPGDVSKTMPGLGFTSSFFASFFATTKTTVTMSLGGRGVTAGWRGGKAFGAPEVEPFGGVGLVLEPKRRNRLVLGVQGSLPVPKLGVNRAVTVTASVGYLFSVARGIKPL